MIFGSVSKSSSPGVNFLAVIGGGFASGLRSWPFKISCYLMPLLFICTALVNLSTQWILNDSRSLSCLHHQQPSNLTSDVLVAMCREKLYNVFSASEDVLEPELIDPIVQEPKRYPAYAYLAYLLLLNAAIFYLPELLRLACGGERLMHQVTSAIEQSPADRFTKLVDLVIYNMGDFRSYVVKRSLCELLCIPICLVQVWIINWYVGGGFVPYGYQVVLNQIAPSSPLSPTFDPIARLFPGLARCLAIDEVTCKLPMNSTNAVIYLIIWWALALQALLLAAAMLRRVYLFVRIQLFTHGKGRLLQSHLKKLSASEISLSAADLTDVCRDNVLNLAVYLTLSACFDDAADLQLFVENIHKVVRTEKKLIEVAMAAKKFWMMEKAVEKVSMEKPAKMLLGLDQRFLLRNFEK